MQAIFRFDGSQEIVVSNQVNGVLVEVIEGTMPGYHGDSHAGSHENTQCSREFCGAEPARPRQAKLLTFSKSQARSVASAIMGAAAEL